MNELQKKLSDIQRKLKAPKGQYNTFAKFHYRSCEDILEAVKPLLNECILVVNDEIVQIGERYYVKSIAELRLGEQSIKATAFAREPFEKKGMDSAQITGSTSSYARKYALNGLFCIDDTKDPDTENNTTTKSQPKRQQATSQTPQDDKNPKPTQSPKPIREFTNDPLSVKEQDFVDKILNSRYMTDEKREKIKGYSNKGKRNCSYSWFEEGGRGRAKAEYEKTHPETPPKAQLPPSASEEEPAPEVKSVQEDLIEQYFELSQKQPSYARADKEQIATILKNWHLIQDDEQRAITVELEEGITGRSAGSWIELITSRKPTPKK